MDASTIMRCACGTVVCLASVAGAAEYNVSSVDELKAAFASAQTSTESVVITLAEGVYDFSNADPMTSSACLTIPNKTDRGWASFTLRGDTTKSRDKIVIDAAQKGRMMYNAWYGNGKVRIENLTIRNGVTTGAYGGGICFEWYNTSFLVTNCTFVGCRATTKGGAVYIGSGNVATVVDCLFLTNSVTAGNGGALNEVENVSFCEFDGNSGAGDSLHGGAILMNNSATVKNCVFRNNSVKGKYTAGAAIYSRGGTITDCTFSNNIATAGSRTGNRHGGAVFAYDGTTKIQGCRFYDNETVWGNGGAIAFDSSKSTSSSFVRDCFFSGNKARNGDGGGVASCPGIVSNCTFVANLAELSGGAVSSCPDVRKCVLARNSAYRPNADYCGGAAYNSTLADCIVTNNFSSIMSGSFSKCRAYRCRIGENKLGNQPNARTVEADSTYFEDCELFGLGNFCVGYTDCGFNRCVVRDNVCTNGYAYFISGKVAVTNTLFARNGAYRMFNRVQAGFPNAIVNCSFVSNKYDVLVHHAADEKALTQVLNNLFYENEPRNAANADDVGILFSDTVYSNNFIKTTQNIKGGGNLNVAEDPALKPRLMMERDSQHPYAPRRRSVLVGAGIVQDWMADSVDLAGQERLTNGKVAIGAYETTDRGPFPGLIMLVR